MKKVLAIAVLCTGSLLPSARVQAQDIHFSQFYENAILRNPALTGIFSGDYKVGVNYRSQWASIVNPFQTVLASVESRIKVNKDLNDYLSFGVTASYDHAGAIDFNSMQIYPAINYNKSLEDKHASYLSVGFAGGYIQRSVNMTKMTLDNQYVNGGYSVNNPTGESLAYTKVTHYDLSAGISLNSSIGENNNITYYLGFAGYHVTKPKEAFNENEDFIRLSTRYTGNFGLLWHINSQMGLTVHANYQNQSPYQETIIGGLLSWRNKGVKTEPNTFILYVGAFYRVQDAIIPTMKVDYKRYSFTMSYDVTNSTLKPSVGGKGGWEFSLFARGKIFKAIDLSKCPRFEDLNQGLFD